MPPPNYPLIRKLMQLCTTGITQIEAAAKRNLHICEKCGLHDFTKELPRHHKNRDRSDNSPDNLEILCVGCHSKEHLHERERNELGRFT